MSESEPTLGNTTEFASHEGILAKYGATAMRFYLQSIARELLPNHRIQVCWRYPLPARETIDIIFSEERKRARAVGTMKCGSAWVCAPCQLFITERRREELGQALTNCRDRYTPFMVTYTASHSKAMGLHTLLSQMQEAYRATRSGRRWQEIKSEFALQGSVRVLEVTYGESGWHPHYHELMLVDNQHIVEYFEGATLEYSEGLEAVLSDIWISELKLKHLSGKKGVALRVSDTNSAAKEYILKYGKLPLDSDFREKANEVSRGMTKAARNGNIGPLEILFNAESNRRYARLFIEYAEATKGKSQLQWSRGLKSDLEIETIRDQMACEGAETDTDRLLAQIPTEMWRFLAEKYHLAQVMTVANTGENAALTKLLKALKKKYNDQLPGLWLPEIGH
jgi:hypothetical protein